MNKISCDVCMDLIPLVKDEVASNDSKQAVLEHIKTCNRCKAIYGEEIIFENNDKKILKTIKKSIRNISIVIIMLGILFGISLSANEFMFYNIIIMPLIGAISYFSLKKKCIYVCLSIFVTVYLRWLIECFGYALVGDFANAFIPPLWWAIIYFALTCFGVLISSLLHFGFKKEN